MAELKPCKWCEEFDGVITDGKIEKIAGNRFAVFCKECGWFTDSYETKQAAIDAWNRRS